MKLYLYIVQILIFIMFISSSKAQELTKEVQTDRYVRNSVGLILMEDKSVPNREILEDAFLSNPWNEKYNNHNLRERVFNPDGMRITRNDMRAFDWACLPTDQYLRLKEETRSHISPSEKEETRSRGNLYGESPSTQALYFEQQYGTPPPQTFFTYSENEEGPRSLGNLFADPHSTFDHETKHDVAVKAYKFLLENNIAQECADKWFLDAEGHYTDEIITQRGLRNVSLSDEQVAGASAAAQQKILREIDLNELIGNTFVVVTRFNYKQKGRFINDRMQALYAGASAANSEDAHNLFSLLELGLNIGAGSGYYVTVDSYLFKLRWNDEIMNEFFLMWDNDTNEFDYERYRSSDLFSLQFIGQERAWAKTKAGIFTSLSEADLIWLAAMDAVDSVLAKFEKKYDQFKTKSPLIVRQDPHHKGKRGLILGVPLGRRDGLDGGEVFEVLEKKVNYADALSPQTTYIKRGEVKVDKGHIWDNTPLALSEEGSEKQGMTRLKGKAKTNYYSGMLLRLKTDK